MFSWKDCATATWFPIWDMRNISFFRTKSDVLFCWIWSEEVFQVRFFTRFSYDMAHNIIWALIHRSPLNDGFEVTMDKVMKIIQIQFTIIIGPHWEILIIKLLPLVLWVLDLISKWKYLILRATIGQLRSHSFIVQKGDLVWSSNFEPLKKAHFSICILHILKSWLWWLLVEDVMDIMRQVYWAFPSPGSPRTNWQELLKSGNRSVIFKNCVS